MTKRTLHAATEPRIVALATAVGGNFGGKVEGLARLIQAGLRVPDGFVIVGARPNVLPQTLEACYQELGSGPVAVRSSASDEDAVATSFAGQYDTILSVVGPEALRRAVNQCLTSLQSERALGYRQGPGRAHESESTHQSSPSPHMNVLVQRMVPARVAGVTFTADPVSQRRSHVVIDAVSGLGDALVDGTQSPDHHLLHRDGRLLRTDINGKRPILTAGELEGLLCGALLAEKHFDRPLDLEWAIDSKGEISWLQARPITTLKADPTTLDTAVGEALDIYTRSNVSEMFPGAATPLSISFTGRAIDVGMQQMQLEVGVQQEPLAENRFIAVFYGHMFLNLTAMSDMATQSFGSTVEQMCLSVCGRTLDEVTLTTKPSPGLARRLANTAKYLRYVLGQRRARRSLKNLVAGLRFRPAHGPGEIWRSIDERIQAIHLAMHYHLVSSAVAGILTPTLLGVIARGEQPNELHQAEVAALLAGAKDVESADIVAGAERIQTRILAQPEARARFVDASTSNAIAWLESPDSGDAGLEYRRYLDRHGHRAVKELELRQVEWATDPTPLVTSLQLPLRFRSNGDPDGSRRSLHQPAEGEAVADRGRALRVLVRLARGAVRAREETKSGLVSITTKFKVAYRELAAAMEREKLLPDCDAAFFLTHQELGRLASGSEPELFQVAVDRRGIFDLQMALEFPEVFVGEPLPLRPTSDASDLPKRLLGVPVSRGRVVGSAHVVRTLEEAASLRPGEILIAPVTDVGWTPYFSMIAGLVTDIGSAVSHGAVVAREYGLPAVVNARRATTVFATGDLIVLDGNTGEVRLASPEDSDAHRTEHNPWR